MTQYLSQKSDIFPVYFFPGINEKELEFENRVFKNKYGIIEVAIPKLEVSLIKNILDRLDYSRKNYLKNKSISDVLNAIYRNAELWSDPNYPYRKKAEELIPITNGFSPPMTHRILDGVADGFRRDLDKIKTEKSDIERVFCVSPNLPGPQALTMVRGLLNKSVVFCKSFFDDVFSPLYAQSYLDIDKELASCIAVVPWDGGKPEYSKIENFIYGDREKNDAIVIFGRSATEDIIKQKAKPDTKIVSFTRGISLGVVGKEMLTRAKVDESASQSALAVCWADQRDCFSLQLDYVEKGGEVSPEEFSEILAKKMQNLESELPRGELSLDASATITELMRTYELLNLTGSLKLHEIKNNGTVVGAVIYKEDKKFEPSSSYRVVRVKPIDDISEVPKLVEPISSSLHTIGVVLSEERQKIFGEEIKQLGAKILPVSQMYKPSILEYELFD